MELKFLQPDRSLKLLLEHMASMTFFMLEVRGNLYCKKDNTLIPSFRSYGSVFKAIHKESGQVVAIKQVPVESDLQEIIKEISIMQQCDR